MPQLDTATLKLAFDIVQTVILAVISIYVWIVTNHKVNAKKIVELEAKHNGELDDLKQRFAKIETKIDYMPDRQQISTIHKRIDDQGKVLHNIEGELKGIGDINSLILKALVGEKS